MYIPIGSVSVIVLFNLFLRHWFINGLCLLKHIVCQQCICGLYLIILSKSVLFASVSRFQKWICLRCVCMCSCAIQLAPIATEQRKGFQVQNREKEKIEFTQLFSDFAWQSHQQSMWHATKPQRIDFNSVKRLDLYLMITLICRWQKYSLHKHTHTGGKRLVF